MKGSKDDSDADEKAEEMTYSEHNFWKLDDQYDLDDLLAEQDQDDVKSDGAVIN
jgi:hypothetical protein